MSAGREGAPSASRSSRIWPARAPRLYSAPSAAESAPISAWARSLVRHACVGSPQTVRAADRRMRGWSAAVVQGAPRRARSASGVLGNAAEDGPGDVALAVADDGVLVRNADLGRKPQRLRHRGRTLERHEVEVGRRRQLRQPRAEPAVVCRRVGAQQQAPRSRARRPAPPRPRRARGSSRAPPTSGTLPWGVVSSCGPTARQVTCSTSSQVP